MSEICFIEAKPRVVATGAETTVRLAGGGADTPYYRDGNHFRAGVIDMPRFRAAFGFDDNGWTGGTVPTSGQLGFMPGDTSLIATLAALYWRDAAITVDGGEESAALSRRLTGTVAGFASNDGQIALTLADPSAILDKPLLGAGFTGGGGVEGAAEATGRPKRRSWGLVFNVEGGLLDKVNNIHEFGDPSKGIEAFLAVRDKGRAGPMTVLAWQGSIAATFAALQAASAPSGGCVVAPSIACVKWWTTPAGPLTADIMGENAGGYVDTAVAIAAKLLAAVGGPAIVAQAAADALRPATCGVHIADATDTIAQAIDRLFLGCSLYWVLQPDGTIRVGEWAWTAPVASFQADFIGRERQLPPVKSRAVGYRRNHRPHSASEISAALLLSDDITYLDGTPLEHLKPAQGGADVTGSHTAAAIAGQGALATQNNAAWESQISGRPGELTDGRITAAIRAGGALQGTIWGGAASVQIAEIFENLLTGKTLSADSDFSRGAVPSTFSIYDNSASGKVAASVVADASAPNGSGKVLRIAYDGTGAPGANPTPGFGGVAQLLNNAGAGMSRPGFYSPNSRVAFIYKAKIPVGRTIEHASNATGDAGGWDWITPNAGTGDWFTYIGIRTIGATGTFSSTGHTFISGGANVAFSWDIARYEQRELSSEALPQLARLIDSTGGIRTDAELITLLGTSAAIVGQGYFATQNYADWTTRVTGSGKPSDNAGRSLTLWTPGTPQYTIQGNTITKIAANGWGLCVFSREMYTGACSITGYFNNSFPKMFGFTDSAGTGDYNELDYAWYNNYGANTLGTYESGNGQGAIAGGYTATDAFTIAYDGSEIKYLKNGVLMRRTSAGAGRTFRAAATIHNNGDTLDGLIFGPSNDVRSTVNTVNPLATFGSYSEVIGNQVRKNAPGTHGSYQGGAYGTPQKGTAFISARPIQNNTWQTFIGLDSNGAGLGGGPNANGSWYAQFNSSSTGGGGLYLIKNGTVVGSWGVPNYAATDRFAIVCNGRRVFAMLNGAVYGGDTSAYDVVPGTTFWPKIWDYYNTGDTGSWVEDVRYGAWTDVRTYLDDGYSVLNQAGFKTDEGTAAGILGQGPGATASGDDVLNYRNINATTIIKNPGGGVYSYDSNITGALRIDLPNGYTSTMVRFAVDVFDYTTGAQQTYIVSGYTYAGDPRWINVSAQYIGSETNARRVRFGYYGAKASILIGESSSTWNYPKVVVRDVIVGYSNQSAPLWKSGWGIVIATTGLHAYDAEVTKPRSADAVFGESIFESAGGASAALTNFKTMLGTAAAIIGQGALATKNNVNMAGSDLLPYGSIPPMLADNGFSYASTTSTINFTWPTMTVYRVDGSSIAISSGSQMVTGLPSASTFKVYPYIVDNGSGSATIQFVTGGGSPSYGTPAMLYASAGNVAAATQSYLQSRVPMGSFVCGTTASGGGGGGGGGWGCLHEDMSLRGVRAGLLAPGDLVDTPDGEAPIDKIIRARCSHWIMLYSGDELVAKATARHPFYRAKDRSEVAAEDVRLGDILVAADRHIEITGLRLCREEAWAVGIGIAAPHLHFAGDARLLCHNGTAKP